WDVEPRPDSSLLPGRGLAVFSPTGELAGLIENTPGELVLTQAGTGTALRRFKGAPNSYASTLLAAGTTLAAAGSWSENGTSWYGVRVWDLASGEERGTLKETGSDISGRALSANGKMLACSSKASVRLYDVSARKELDPVPCAGLPRVFALSPDGKS